MNRPTHREQRAELAALVEQVVAEHARTDATLWKFRFWLLGATLGSGTLVAVIAKLLD